MLSLRRRKGILLPAAPHRADYWAARRGFFGPTVRRRAHINRICDINLTSIYFAFIAITSIVFLPYGRYIGRW